MTLLYFTTFDNFYKTRFTRSCNVGSIITHVDFSLFVGKRLWDIPEIFHVQDLGSRHRIEHIFRIERRTQSLQHAMIKDVPLIYFTINIISI